MGCVPCRAGSSKVSSGGPTLGHGVKGEKVKREKKSEEQKEEAWAAQTARKEDQSQMGTYHRPVLCDTHVHLVHPGLIARTGQTQGERQTAVRAQCVLLALLTSCSVRMRLR